MGIPRCFVSDVGDAPKRDSHYNALVVGMKPPPASTKGFRSIVLHVVERYDSGQSTQTFTAPTKRLKPI